MLVECIPKKFNEIKLSIDCKSILAAATNENVERIKVVEQPAPNLSGLMNKIHKISVSGSRQEWSNDANGVCAARSWTRARDPRKNRKSFKS